MARRKSKRKQVAAEPLLVEGIDSKSTVRCLAFDPGVNNFACSILRGRLKHGKLKFRIDGTCMIKHSIAEPKVYLRSQATAFKKEFGSILRKYGPFDICIAERFQSRGFGGNTIENINMMLGIMATMFKGKDMRIITAATWKNAFNRQMDLKECYAERKHYDTIKTDHEFDASMIGVYRMSQVFGLKPFEQFDEEDNIELLEKYMRSPSIKV